MKKDQLMKLCLFCTPLIVSTFFGSFNHTLASEVEERTIRVNVVDSTVTRSGNQVGLEKNEFGDDILNFTVEESDSAIAMFGCDCISSLNKLKRLRGETVGVHRELLTDEVFLARCPHQLIMG